VKDSIMKNKKSIEVRESKGKEREIEMNTKDDGTCARSRKN
jgi:hypothetical protein